MTEHWKFLGLLAVNGLLALSLWTTPAAAGEEGCVPCYSGTDTHHQGVTYHSTYPYSYMDEEHPGVDNIHGEEVLFSCFNGSSDFHACCEPGGGAN